MFAYNIRVGSLVSKFMTLQKFKFLKLFIYSINGIGVNHKSINSYLTNFNRQKINLNVIFFSCFLMFDISTCSPILSLLFLIQSFNHGTLCQESPFHFLSFDCGSLLLKSIESFSPIIEGLYIKARIKKWVLISDSRSNTYQEILSLYDYQMVSTLEIMLGLKYDFKADIC